MAVGHQCGGCPTVGHDLWRDHFAKRHDHQVIEIPYDRDEIGDQVDGRAGV